MTRRWLVVVGVSSALVVGGATQATAAEQPMTCELSIGSASPLPAWTPDMELVAEPDAASSGDSVSLLLDVGEYTNGPVPIAIGQLTPNAVVELRGGQTGEVPLAGVANTEAILSLTPFEPGPMTGTFDVEASGDIELFVTRITFDNPQVDIICTPTADAVVQALVTVEGAASPPDSPSGSPTGEEPTPTDDATEAASEGDDEGGSALPWILLGLAAVAAVAGACWYFGSRRRTTAESPAGSETGQQPSADE